MPKKIPIATGKKWLVLLDAGETEAQIARKESHDPRTVKRAIEEARRDRDLTAIRIEALKNAYRRHQDRLLDVLGTAKNYLTPPPQELGLRAPGTQQPERFEVLGCEVVCSDSEAPSVIFEMKESLLWQLLREHLSGDSLWGEFARWKLAVGRLVEVHLELNENTRRVLEETTGLNVGEALQIEGVHQVYRLAVEEAVEDRGTLTGAADHLEVDDGSVKILMRRDQVGWSLGEGTTLLKDVGQALVELSKSDEVLLLRSAQRRAVDLAETVEQTIELIQAGWYIPGKCRACERFRQ
jgi:hypothetical protein